MKKRIVLCIVFVLLAFSSDCINPLQQLNNMFNKAPDIAAVTRTIKVSLPLAYAANVALDAVNKQAFSGVTMNPSLGDTFPYSGMVTIPISKAHPLPVGLDSSGTIVVLGLWSSRNEGVMSVFFTSRNIKDGTFTLANIAFVPAQRDSITGATTVVFAAEDINADSTTVVTTKITDSLVAVKLQGIPLTLPTDSNLAVTQKAWIVVVSPNPDPGAATYSLYGAGQYIGVQPSTTELVQAAMVNVVFTPDTCRHNPISGYALINDLKILNSQTNSTEQMGSTVLTFNKGCSGSATITLATGVYLARTGSSAALNLDQ